MFKKTNRFVYHQNFSFAGLFYTYSVATKENGKNGKVSWKGNQKSDCGSFLLLIELVLEFPIFGVTSFCTRVQNNYAD